MQYTILNSDLKETLDKLTTVSKSCTDVIIKNGKIQQFSDDNKLIFSVTLPVKFNANLQMVKGYIDIFKVFLDDQKKKEEDEPEKEIYITITDANERVKYLTISDEFSEVTLVMGDEKYMNAKYVDDETFEKVLDSEIDTIEMTEKLIKRINTFASNFVSEIVSFEVKNGNCSIKIESPSATKQATIVTVDTKLPEGIYEVPIGTFSFPLEEDPVIEIYSTPKPDKYVFVLNNGRDKVYAISKRQ